MTLQGFAERYRFRIRKDSCDDAIIPGRRTDKKSKLDRLEDHHNVFEFEGIFGVYLNFPTKPRWTYAKKAVLAAGFKLRQDGECDGVLTFDPENQVQVKLLIKVAGLRVKRQLTDEQKAQIRERFAKKAV